MQASRIQRPRDNDKDTEYDIHRVASTAELHIGKLRFWDIRQIRIFISMQSSDHSPLNIFSSSEFTAVYNNLI